MGEGEEAGEEGGGIALLQYRITKRRLSAVAARYWRCISQSAVLGRHCSFINSDEHGIVISSAALRAAGGRCIIERKREFAW